MATDIAKLLLLYKCQENARIRAGLYRPPANRNLNSNLNVIQITTRI